MKLSITIHGKIYSVESDDVHDGSDVYELAEQFKGLLVSAGYHPCNVDSIFSLDRQWFTEEERNNNMQGHLKDNKYNEGYAKGWDEALHNRKVQDFQDSLYKQDDDFLF